MKASQLLKEFQATAQAAGGDLQQFAYMDGYPLVGAVLGKDGPCIAFLAGLHGDEPGGMHAVNEYLRARPIPPCKVILVPLLNTSGFDLGTRKDDAGKDPNRQFCNEPEGISQQIVEYLEFHKTRFLTTLHEDPHKDGLYLYYSNFNDRSFYQRLIRHARKYFPILKEKFAYGNRVDGGLILHDPADSSPKNRCSLENYAYTKLGCHYLTTEPPGDAPLPLRVQFLAEVIDLVIQHESR